MDTSSLSSLLAPIATVVLSIAAVSSFLGKVLPSTVKYVRLASDAINALDDIVESLVDGKLTPDELDKLKNDLAKFKADLK